MSEKQTIFDLDSSSDDEEYDNEKAKIIKNKKQLSSSNDSESNSDSDSESCSSSETEEIPRNQPRRSTRLQPDKQNSDDSSSDESYDPDIDKTLPECDIFNNRTLPDNLEDTIENLDLGPNSPESPPSSDSSQCMDETFSSDIVRDRYKNRAKRPAAKRLRLDNDEFRILSADETKLLTPSQLIDYHCALDEHTSKKRSEAAKQRYLEKHPEKALKEPVKPKPVKKYINEGFEFAPSTNMSDIKSWRWLESKDQEPPVDTTKIYKQKIENMSASTYYISKMEFYCRPKNKSFHDMTWYDGPTLVDRKLHSPIALLFKTQERWDSITGVGNWARTSKQIF